jgi:hypothetical protein
LAEAFYAAGPGATLTKVTSFLKSLAERGILSIKDPDLAAEQLIVSWLGMSQLRQNLGVTGPPSADVIAKRVRYATDTMGTCVVEPFVAAARRARRGRDHASGPAERVRRALS